MGLCEKNNIKILRLLTMPSVRVGIANVALFVDDTVAARSRSIGWEVPPRMFYVEGAVVGDDLALEHTVGHRAEHRRMGLVCRRRDFDL